MLVHGVMMEAEMSMNLTALNTPETCPRDLSPSLSPSISNANFRESAAKQAVFNLIQHLYSLVTTEDADSLAIF